VCGRSTEQATRVWLHVHVCMHVPHTARCMDYWAQTRNRTITARHLGCRVMYQNSERGRLWQWVPAARPRCMANPATASHGIHDTAERCPFRGAVVQADGRPPPSWAARRCTFCCAGQQPRPTRSLPCHHRAVPCYARCCARNSTGLVKASSAGLMSHPAAPFAPRGIVPTTSTQTPCS